MENEMSPVGTPKSGDRGKASKTWIEEPVSKRPANTLAAKIKNLSPRLEVKRHVQGEPSREICLKSEITSLVASC